MVEILIATALTAGLFAGLWTILGIFAALQSRSELHTARAQITRGLIHQIQDDLDQIVVAPRRRSAGRSNEFGSDTANDSVLAETELGETAASLESIAADGLKTVEGEKDSRESDQQSPSDPTTIALRGSSHWIIMDLLLSRPELAREQPSAMTHSPFGGAGNGTPARARACRKRVLYFFVSPELALVEETLQAGLGRWEIPTSVSIDETVQELNEGKFGSPNSRLWEQFSPNSGANDLFPSSGISDDRQLSGDPTKAFDIPHEHIPEMERFFIRYLGDQGWDTSWDSNQQALPSAIECLVVWRDPRAMRDERLAANNHNPIMTSDVAAETGDRDAREELDQVRLLAAWERLGQEDFIASPQELPSGFARYLFCLPAAPLKNRSLPELSDQFTAGITP